MISYQGRTFCNYYRSCKAGEFCTRALTPVVRESAADLDLPIARFVDIPNCFDMKEDDDEQGEQTTTSEPEGL